eukprot:scaffold9049_cov105-Isochrysis_galbana.AAC.4
MDLARETAGAAAADCTAHAAGTADVTKVSMGASTARRHRCPVSSRRTSWKVAGSPATPPRSPAPTTVHRAAENTAGGGTWIRSGAPATG